MAYETKVVSLGPSSEKPGAWLRLKTVRDDGKEADAYIKDAALFPLVNKPGVYEFAKTKNGKFWDITGVKFLRPLEAAQPASNGQPAAQAPRVAGALDPNVVLQNKSITAQVAIKAAAELFGSAVAAGAFKNETGIDTDLLEQSAANLARKFINEASDFIFPDVKAEPKTNGVYKDDAGRTHEPVGVEGA